jgi:hypothetical protein
MSAITMRPSITHAPHLRLARAGLWLLSVYGLLLGLSTLTHQPPVADFDAYARYVSTDQFMVSHLGASIFGAALGLLGVIALTTFLIRGPAARTAMAGLVVTTISSIGMAAAFGSAAFAQPGIGRAHLQGVPGMADLNADTAYGPALFATALSSTALLMVGTVLIGIAIARTRPDLRWHGTGYAVLLFTFAGPGMLVGILQPVAGFAFAVTTAALAIRLNHVTRRGSAGQLEYTPIGYMLTTRRW